MLWRKSKDSVEEEEWDEENGAKKKDQWCDIYTDFANV